jgi:ferric-dicitrate binding protein FerR (iron transport regulator)
MNENPEKRDEIPSQEDQELIDSWLAKYASEEIPPEKRRECGPEVAELEQMFEDFEKTHDLEALSAITDITTLEEAQAHPTWMPAQRALHPIYAKFRVLKDETNITDEKHAELKAKWKRLTQTIGMINDGKLDRSPR